jgi:hypothetical protein
MSDYSISVNIKNGMNGMICNYSIVTVHLSIYTLTMDLVGPVMLGDTDSLSHHLMKNWRFIEWTLNKQTIYMQVTSYLKETF